MKKSVFVLAGMLVSILALPKEIISAKVVNVIDGNTVEVIAEDKESYKIQLFGIDCPELGQNFGYEAKNYLEKIMLGKSVTVEMKGKDRWGNRLGIVLIDGKVDPRVELLEEGLAWTAEINPIPELEGIKEGARVKGKGLWKEESPTPPWIFRRHQTLTQFKSS
jgi:micrococcal nuclease